MRATDRRFKRASFEFAFTRSEIRTMVLAIQKALWPIFDALNRPRDRVLFYVALTLIAEGMYEESRIDGERRIAI